MSATPDKYFDGTNPILTITGDEPTERDVSMTNNASIVKTELLTNTQLPPGQTVLVRVKGDIAYDQLMSNLEQINAFEGFEVIGVASVPVNDGGNLVLLNAAYISSLITYTGGKLAGALVGADGFIVSQPISMKQGELVFNPEALPSDFAVIALITNLDQQGVLEHLSDGNFPGIMVNLSQASGVSVKVDGSNPVGIPFNASYTSVIRIETDHISTKTTNYTTDEVINWDSPVSIVPLEYIHFMGYNPAGIAQGATYSIAYDPDEAAQA